MATASLQRLGGPSKVAELTGRKLRVVRRGASFHVEKRSDGEARAIASADGRALSVIGFVTGTADDPQNRAAQRECLLQAGVTLADSSSAAAMMVLALLAQLAAAAPSQSALNLAGGKAERSKAVVS